MIIYFLIKIIYSDKKALILRVSAQKIHLVKVLLELDILLAVLDNKE